MWGGVHLDLLKSRCTPPHIQHAFAMLNAAGSTELNPVEYTS